MTKQLYFTFFALLIGLFAQAQNTTMGSVFYHNLEPIPDATMSVNGQTATTDANGDYTIEWADAAVAYLVGEKIADYSTGINMLDVVAMRNHILALASLENVQRIAGDVNDSGSLTTYDMVLVMKQILGLDSYFEINSPNLVFLPEECNTSSSLFCGAYADLNADSDNVQNFYGVKKGDVVQNAPINTTIQPVFTLEQVGCNEEVHINCVATEYDDAIAGVQFSMRWDVSKFNFSSIETNNSALQLQDYNVNAEEGFLTIAYLSNLVNMDIETGDDLFTLSLAPIGDYGGETVVFDNAPTDILVTTWAEEVVEATFNNVVLTEDFVGTITSDITVENASTETANDGVIIVNEVEGGVFPYHILLVETNTTGNTHSNLAPGDYTLEITDASGCTWTETVTVGSPVGVLDVFENDWLTLSQNPIAQGTSAQIQFLEAENDEVNLLIVNSLGQTIAQQKENITANTIIDLPAITTAGMYWIIVENGERLARLPLVVQ